MSAPTHTSKLRLKMEQLARWRVALRPDTQIAEKLGISYGNLQVIIRRPEYLAIEADVRRRVLAKQDSQLDERSEQMFQDFEDALPDALKNIITTARQQKDLKLALEASKELLDRDPRSRFSKRRGAVGEAAPTPESLPPSVVDSLARDNNHASELLNNVFTQPSNEQVN